jgi:hypothetical protein
MRKVNITTIGNTPIVNRRSMITRHQRRKKESEDERRRRVESKVIKYAGRVPFLNRQTDKTPQTPLLLCLVGGEKHHQRPLSSETKDKTRKESY